ncbi:hypothetical protein C0989_012373 [Termitomyces sp. Mn162]|nr:hypothetical protein C0989_012373 [Termitomyces sp. Mn162]
MPHSAKFTDDNWMEWLENMEMFFMGVGADWVVSGTVAEGDMKMDKVLVAYIYASIEPEQCYRIKGMKSAATAWAALKQAYQKSTMGHHICAHKEWWEHLLYFNCCLFAWVGVLKEPGYMDTFDTNT